MNQLLVDEKFMRRCLQLAENGLLTTRPNPMVGAVIVRDNKIIGEGFHIRNGEPHAEVNAVKDALLRYTNCNSSFFNDCTIYINLEPCSHYGKTPPCADMIIEKKFKRVVVGCLDSFEKVAGRGIEKLRNAGIEVTIGVLEKECRHLNRRFFTYHEKKRPFITLKWAQSSNGFIDNNFKAEKFSTPYSQMLVHKLRSENDAILVGRITEEREHPKLNVREWVGKSPRKIVLSKDSPLDLKKLYEEGIQTILVEGGRKTLQWFIDNSLYDEIRVEVSPKIITRGTEAPIVLNSARVK